VFPLSPEGDSFHTRLSMRKLMLALSILVFFTVVSILSYIAHSAGLQLRSLVDITAYNPYSLDVELEVKCDHDFKTGKFLYYRKIVVPGKASKTIRVPASLKKCQIWPKISWW